jgi:hypothetical protein
MIYKTLCIERWFYNARGSGIESHEKHWIFSKMKYALTVQY